MWKWEAEGQPKATVVLFHNAYEHHGRHAWLIERFRTAGMHVIAGDLPGHGSRGTDVHDEAIQEYRDFAGRLVKAGLAESVPLFLYGHGLGGLLAADQARLEGQACAGLILTSPWFALDHLPPKMKGALSGIGKIASGIKFNHRITEEMLTRSQENGSPENGIPSYQPVATAGWYRELNLYMKEMSELPAAGVPPVLLHTGGKDTIANRGAAREWLVREGREEFQYKTWKNCRHDIFLEPEKEEVFLYTEAFINSVLRSLGYVA
ncbi:alpha/beta hydrolase [Edaphobacillus lindanitolerans]|uniref:Lysophospholipase n=1 Tax=Edaphobacillus lindanitolerans TaxID=550447 RepID=A0A1U7PKQ3_9BACI|nr:alpha/beta hydrolase [Edaphobacillus lindanitolerans]SIT85711.1 lysophospholipase [Edaphobacillus lindanitolerans]